MFLYIKVSHNLDDKSISTPLAGSDSVFIKSAHWRVVARFDINGAHYE